MNKNKNIGFSLMLGTAFFLSFLIIKVGPVYSQDNAVESAVSDIASNITDIASNITDIASNITDTTSSMTDTTSNVTDVIVSGEVSGKGGR